MLALFIIAAKPIVVQLFNSHKYLGVHAGIEGPGDDINPLSMQPDTIADTTAIL